MLFQDKSASNVPKKGTLIECHKSMTLNELHNFYIKNEIFTLVLLSNL